MSVKLKTDALLFTQASFFFFQRLTSIEDALVHLFVRPSLYSEVGSAFSMNESNRNTKGGNGPRGCHRRCAFFVDFFSVACLLVRTCDRSTYNDQTILIFPIYPNLCSKTLCMLTVKLWSFSRNEKDKNQKNERGTMFSFP